MNTRIATMAVAAAAVLVASAAVVAHAAPEDAHRCVWSFEPSGPIVVAGAAVVGGYAQCNPAPEAFALRLRLFARSGSGWVLRDEATTTTIPNPWANLAVRDLDCVSGGYRAEYDMAETAGGYTRQENGATTGFVSC